jgi:tetratricopeptide (TPR) repeat protein
MLRNHDAPIHPRVAEHFGLAWHTPEMRYRLDHDGWFTYEDWVRRFLGFRHDLRCYQGYWHTFKTGGDRKQGETDLRGALADAPENAQARFYLAANLQWTGRPAEALKELETALVDMDVAADPRLAALHAEILLRLNRAAEAADAARRATTLLPEVADFHRLLGRALRESGRSSEALASFKEAVNIDPFKLTNWNELGFQLVTEKDEQAAEACFLRVLEFDADNGLALRHLSTIYENRRDFERALPMARRAVSLDPDNRGCQRGLGSIALRAGLPEESETAYRYALALDKKDFYAWFGLGTALLRQGRMDEANEATQSALALEAKNAHFNFQAGEIRASLGDHATAREYFRVAAELAPDNAKMRAKYEAVK